MLLVRRVLAVPAAVAAGFLMSWDPDAVAARPPADVRVGPDERHVLDDGVADTPKELADVRDGDRPAADRREGRARQRRGADHPAQHGPQEGHLPGSSSNVELVGRLRVRDAVPDRIADVSAFGNYAYLNAFSEPECRRGGVYVLSIRDPGRPQEVNFLESPAGTYSGEGSQVIDLNTTSFKGQLLVTNNEVC